MFIKSPNLILQPLTIELARDVEHQRRDAHAWAEDFPTSDDVRMAGAIARGDLVAVRDDYPWGPYLIVQRVEQTVVGGIGIKGAPNERGEVEIGYGVCPSVRSRGVATEAVGALLQYCGELGVLTVLADTELENRASQRVLVNNGFLEVGVRTTLVLWRRSLIAPE